MRRRRANVRAKSIVPRAMRRRSTQARSIKGAATSQNGNVAPSARPPRAIGTQSSATQPTRNHAISIPTRGVAARAVADFGVERARTEGDTEIGAISMVHSGGADGPMLIRTGLIV